MRDLDAQERQVIAFKHTTYSGADAYEFDQLARQRDGWVVAQLTTEPSGHPGLEDEIVVTWARASGPDAEEG